MFWNVPVLCEMGTQKLLTVVSETVRFSNFKLTSCLVECRGSTEGIVVTKLRLRTRQFNFHDHPTTRPSGSTLPPKNTGTERVRSDNLHSRGNYSA